MNRRSHRMKRASVSRRRTPPRWAPREPPSVNRISEIASRRQAGACSTRRVGRDNAWPDPDQRRARRRQDPCRHWPSSTGRASDLTVSRPERRPVARRQAPNWKRLGSRVSLTVIRRSDPRSGKSLWSVRGGLPGSMACSRLFCGASESNGSTRRRPLPPRLPGGWAGPARRWDLVPIRAAEILGIWFLAISLMTLGGIKQDHTTSVFRVGDRVMARLYDPKDRCSQHCAVLIDAVLFADDAFQDLPPRSDVLDAPGCSTPQSTRAG